MRHLYLLAVAAAGQPTRSLRVRGTGSVLREACLCGVRGRPAALAACPYHSATRPRASPTYVFEGRWQLAVDTSMS